MTIQLFGCDRYRNVLLFVCQIFFFFCASDDRLFELFHGFLIAGIDPKVSGEYLGSPNFPDVLQKINLRNGLQLIKTWLKFFTHVKAWMT